MARDMSDGETQTIWFHSYVKYNKQNKWTSQTKWKQTHRHRKQSTGYQRDEGGDEMGKGGHLCDDEPMTPQYKKKRSFSRRLMWLLQKEEEEPREHAALTKLAASVEPWAADTRMSSTHQGEADLLITEQVQTAQEPQIHWAWILHHL